MDDARIVSLFWERNEDAIQAAAKKRRPLWIAPVAAAVCLCIILCILHPKKPSYDAPYQVRFQSCADLDTLIHADQLSDKELEQFLQEKGFSSRLMSTRNDVEHMVAALRKTGYPAAEGAFSLAWLPGCRYDFVYTIDGVQYGFYYTATQNQTPRIRIFSVAAYDIGGRTVRFYSGATGIVGEFYAAGFQIRITVRGYESLSDISFSQFQWVCPADEIS